MAGWKEWMGKKVFIISKNSSHPYTGTVIEIDDSNPLLVWLVITDKFEQRVQFSVNEILSIKEDRI